MAISQNGYSVFGSSSGLSDFKWVTGRVRPGDTAVVLDYLASRFNNEVEAIRKDWSWGYAFRAIRGKTSGYSNHASGTAVDFNAPKHALGRSGTFTAAQRNRIHSILRDMDQVVRWGGDYSGRKDEMHFEVNVNAARLKEFANKVRNKTAPGLSAPRPAWKPTNGPISLDLTNARFKAAYDGKKVARTSGIGLIQKALNAKAGTKLTVDGYAGKSTLAAYAAYERKIKGAGKSNVTTVDADILRRLGLEVQEDAKKPAPAPAPVKTHIRWATRGTGVHETPGGKKIRDIPEGYKFRVVDGSGHGTNGWVKTSAGNWVLGKDTTTSDPVLPVRVSIMDWNVENKGDADAALDRAEIIRLVDEEKPHYFALQEVYRVDLQDIPGYQTYHAWDGYPVNSENRAQALLVRDDVDIKVKQALQMEEEWVGPKVGAKKEPRVHRYVTGNLNDVNIPVATFHAPFGKDAVEETRLAAVAWLQLMKQYHGVAFAVGDWNSLAADLQAKVGDPAGATVDGGGLDKIVFLGAKKVKGENLGNRGRSDHPVKIWTFEI